MPVPHFLYRGRKHVDGLGADVTVHDIYVFEGLDGGDKLFDDKSGLRF